MESVIALILGVLGAGLGLIAKILGKSRLVDMRLLQAMPVADAAEKPRLKSVTLVLCAFAVIVIAYGAATAYLNWDKLVAEKESLFFGAWLFLAMVGGMFAQVLQSATKEGSDFSNISASQLLFPLLFSIMVFYPIWAVGTSASNNFFAIYAAFVNGFFWKTVVANTRIPAPGTNDKQPKDSVDKK
jgi:hypothetical protein